MLPLLMWLPLCCRLGNLTLTSGCRLLPAPSVADHSLSTALDDSAQVLDATKRLGCEEMGGYEPLKAHPFFDSITWENLHHQTPPKLTAYLPAMSEDDEDCYGNVSPSVDLEARGRASGCGQ